MERILKILENITPKQIQYVIYGIIALFILILEIMIHKIRKRTEESVKQKGQYAQRILQSTGKLFSIAEKSEKIKLFLTQYGANYMLGRPIAPEEYILMNCILALVLGLVGFIALKLVGLAIGVLLGYNLLRLLLLLSNRQDNEGILYDMKGIYDTLMIKTQGGMFLTSAIQECYKSAKNRRLKKALLEMHSEIVTKSDVATAVENLSLKFRNKYIDTFCVIIKQSMESGKAVEILRDMSEQMADMQQAINIKTKEKLESQIEAIQLLIYVGVIALCIYGLIQSMNGII